MIITRKSSQFVSSLPTVTLNSSPIQLVSSFKYLGVIISSNLSWSLHIQSVSSKVRKHTGMIYRNFYIHSSPQILLKLYNALILPHFNYCSSVWSPPDSSVNSSQCGVPSILTCMLEIHWRGICEVCHEECKICV